MFWGGHTKFWHPHWYYPSLYSCNECNFQPSRDTYFFASWTKSNLWELKLDNDYIEAVKNGLYSVHFKMEYIYLFITHLHQKINSGVNTNKN